eukprot:942409_1
MDDIISFVVGIAVVGLLVGKYVQLDDVMVRNWLQTLDESSHCHAPLTRRTSHSSYHSIHIHNVMQRCLNSLESTPYCSLKRDRRVRTGHLKCNCNPRLGIDLGIVCTYQHQFLYKSPSNPSPK